MTKIVNNLSAKMEIGSPMACMYLLRNPDHYTNMKFVPFFWQGYLCEARRVWHPVDTNDHVEKITLMKNQSRIIGLSPVNDYIYCSVELEDMCLYDWVCRCKQEKLSKFHADNHKFEDQLEDLSDEGTSFSSSNSVNTSAEFHINHKAADKPKSEKVTQAVKIVKEKDTSSHIGLFKFLAAHPLQQSHGTQCVPENSAVVPNSKGATLPRCDQGDREYYTSAMLTLFRPWCSGHDLKTKDQSWDESFLLYDFSHRQKDLMANFNI